MGTAISVDVRDPSFSTVALDDVFAWFRWVDETFTTYNTQSQVSRLGRGEIDTAGCDACVGWVLERCEELRLAINGFFDAWASGTLDPSGLVKGWSVEVASSMLVERGSTNHCINAGGDIRLRGVPQPGRAWRAGVSHPLAPGRLTVVIEGTDLAVATSGTAERGLHVIDPHTRRPAAALASVTVLGAELTVTDGYATAAMAMGLDAPKWLATLPGHDAYVIDAGSHVWWTPGLPRYAPALATGVGAVEAAVEGDTKPWSPARSRPSPPTCL